MMKHFPKEIVKKKNDSSHIIWFKNGSIWRLLGADDIDNLRGITGIDFVLDEYAEMKKDVWPTLRPIIDENHGTVTFVFTPKGKNHGWRILKYAKNHPEDWFCQVLTADDTHAISEEDIAMAKDDPNMTEAFFLQEYYCNFTESGSQFFRKVRENLWDGMLESIPDKSYWSGVDLGKYQDFTVITNIDIITHQVGTPERFNQIDWPLQETRILTNSRLYNNSLTRIDSTGLGDPVFDHLIIQAPNINLEPIKFTAESRERLLKNLAVLMEKDQLVLPNYEVLLAELEGFQWVLKENGRVTIQSSAAHDDCVMSLALAVLNLQPDRFMNREPKKNPTTEEEVKNLIKKAWAETPKEDEEDFDE